MSLIVFFSTDAGIVVVGDRATTGAEFALGARANLAGGAVASASKVFAFGSNTVFGVTGVPTIRFLMDDGTHQTAFSASSLIIGYGLRHPYAPDSDAFWDGMLECNASELMAKAPPGPAWTPPADGFIFQAMFAHVPSDGSPWSYRCFRVFASTEGPNVALSREVVPHRMPGVHATGNDLVYREISGGKDPRFDDVRSEPVFRRAAARKNSPDEAVAFGKRMCAVTSERRLLLEAVDTGHNVSRETDGWLVKRTGWIRLHKNER